MKPAPLLAASLLLVAAAHGQLDPAEWSLDGCATLAPDTLTLSTCGSGCSEYALASQVPTLPGTFNFDVEFSVDAANPLTFFSIVSGTTPVLIKWPADSWCTPTPCTGSDGHFTVHVTPPDGLRLSLDAAEMGCGTPPFGAGGTHVQLTNVRFRPDPGVWQVAGALDAALHAKLPSPSTSSNYGQSLALLEDLDGDGLADVVIGAFSEKAPGVPGSNSPGAVRVQSSASGAVLQEKFGSLTFERLGTAVAAPGDLDGDGLPDFSASGTSSVRAWSGATGHELLHVLEPAELSFGASLCGAGDVDLDGVPDLAVGVPNADFNKTGRVRLVSGADGSTIWEVKNLIDVFDARLGTSVAGVGDQDGDGRPDLLAGAPASSGTLPAHTGRALLLSGLAGATLHVYPGDVLSEHFGSGVCAVGDADADGTTDFAVGASYFEGEVGLVRVFSGATDQPLFTVTGLGAGEFLGYVTQLSGAGDVDGDGHDDLLLGAPSTYYGGNGHIRVYNGSDGELLFEHGWPVHEADFGAAVSGGLDFTGDGRPDLAVGAPHDDAGQAPYSGKVVLLSGVPEHNVVPELDATGPLEPDSLLSVAVLNLTPDGIAVLVIGLSTVNQPYKGGLLVPSPDMLLGGLELDDRGELEIHGRWPAGLSGTTTWMQAWSPSPVAAHGFVATNAIALVAP